METFDQQLERAIYRQGLPDPDTLTEFQANVLEALRKACREYKTDAIRELSAISYAMPREIRTGVGPIKKALNVLVDSGFVRIEYGYNVASKIQVAYYQPQPAQ